MAIKQTKRFGTKKELMSFSFEVWFAKKLRGDMEAKANMSVFIQDAISKKMGWKAPLTLIRKK